MAKKARSLFRFDYTEFLVVPGVTGVKSFCSCLHQKRFYLVDAYLHKVEKILKGSLDFIPTPSTFTFSENSNYGRESCQQILCFQKFVDNTQQCFAFTPRANFPAHNLNFHWRRRWRGSNPSYLLKSFLLYIHTSEVLIFIINNHNNPFFLQVRDISPSTNDNKFYTFIIKPWNINQQQQKWIDECHLKYQISNLQAQIELNLGLYTYVCLNFQETNKTNGSRSQTLVYAIFLVCSKFY